MPEPAPVSTATPPLKKDIGKSLAHPGNLKRT
jgi:hypothetical protein